jgi:hypothetical protein
MNKEKVNGIEPIISQGLPYNYQSRYKFNGKKG